MRVRTVATVTLAGEPWKINYGPKMKTDVGLCRYNSKTLRITDNLPPVRELDTLIHEALHATNRSLSEEYVDFTSTELAMMLHKLGYRKVEDD